MGGRTWTAEEIDYLQSSWGTTSIQGIANHLNRTVTAVERKVIKLKLGPFMLNSEYITMNQLYQALGLSNGNETRWQAWILKRDFPVKLIKIKTRKLKAVYIDDFWKWAEVNQDILDLSKLEPLVLGVEPAWVSVKRKQDFLRKRISNKGKPWTHYDDILLIGLLKEYKYTYKELAQLIGRTPTAIAFRIRKLNIPYRPLGKETPATWSDGDEYQLKELLFTGRSRQELAIYFNRTVRAINAKLFQLFGTKSITKIKENHMKTAIK